MKHFAFFDISDQASVLSVRNQDGVLVQHTTTVTDPNSMAVVLKKVPGQLEIVGIETGPQTNYLVRELKQRHFPAVAVDAHKLKPFLDLKINKTDDNDADCGSEAMRLDALSDLGLKVHTGSEESNELKSLVRTRSYLVRERASLRKRIKSTLKFNGITLPSADYTIFVEVVCHNLTSLSSMAKMPIEAMLHAYTAIHTQVEKLSKKVQDLADKDQDAQLLQTIPGVGPVVALTIKAEIGEPTRFKNSKAVGAYAGLTPTQYSSGTTVKKGRISKRGNVSLRTAMVEAGAAALKSKKYSQITQFAGRMRRKGYNTTSVAIGRKLLVIAHQVLVKKEPFRVLVPEPSRSNGLTLTAEELRYLAGIAEQEKTTLQITRTKHIRELLEQRAAEDECTSTKYELVDIS